MKISHKVCFNCNNIFYKQYYRSVDDWESRAKFCSTQCHNKYRKGKPSCSPSTTFKKGQINFVPYESRRRGKDNNKWKGGQLKKKCFICKSVFLVDRYRKDAKTCSIKCFRQYQNTNEFRNKLSEIVRSKIPQIFVSTRKLRSLLRRCSLYNRWRNKVFKRDNYTCQMCDIRGGKLHADHIRPFLKVMLENNINTYKDAVKCKKLWSIKNGRTLCKSCHYKTDTFGSKVHNII